MHLIGLNNKLQLAKSQNVYIGGYTKLVLFKSILPLD